jgi:hypothetical protein
MHATKTIPAILSASALALCFAGPASAQSDYQTVPIDQHMDVNNVQVACTGVGDHEEGEARWNNYPVKLETVNGRGQYLAGEKITLRGDDGAQMVQVKCDAPWVLMKLDPGRYSATVQAPDGMAKHISLRVPGNGSQREVVVRFPQQSAGLDNDVMLSGGAS